MTFKTQAEIWKYLLEGGKVKLCAWSDGRYIHLKNGFLEYNSGHKYQGLISYPSEWEIWGSPKTKPKVKLYEVIYWDARGVEETPAFLDAKLLENLKSNWKHVHVLREIEVEE